MTDRTTTLDDGEVMAVLTSVFNVEWNLHLNGTNRHEAEQGMFPANIHVELAEPTYGGHWSASLGADGDDGIAWAYPGGAMAEPEDLLVRGIQPGSLEELREVLEALRFNAGQAIEEMRRAFVAATGAQHVYVEGGGR